MNTSRNARGHVADNQPLAHLFTVPLDEVKKRVTAKPRKPRRRPVPASTTTKESA